MMIKFYASGSSGAASAAYLEEETDHKRRPRAGVYVLLGSTARVSIIANSLSFKHRTTSAVIAWAPEDNLGQSDINTVLDSFEKLAFACLEPDRTA